MKTSAAPPETCSPTAVSPLSLRGQTRSQHFRQCTTIPDYGIEVEPDFVEHWLTDPVPPWADVATVKVTSLRGNASTDPAGRDGGGTITINPKHKGYGVTVEPHQVPGRLLNTVVHETTHLTTVELAAEQLSIELDPLEYREWIVDDHCASDRVRSVRRRLQPPALALCRRGPRGEDRRTGCRARVVSYQLGNLAQCFVWAASQPQGGDPLKACMDTKTGDQGITLHEASADALDVTRWLTGR